MRLDLYLVQQGLAPTRTRAANLIHLGGVTVNGIVVQKSAYIVGPTDTVQVTDVIEYASLGGLKLQHAIRTFGLSVGGLCAVDIGASNGGFCDCLLAHGAAKVYAVDVGPCALPPRLVQDSRVVPMPDTDARTLTPAMLGHIDCATVDVSFISVTYILPTLYALLPSGAWAVVLVKPQFEVGPRALGKSGVVRDDALRQKAVDSVTRCAVGLGFEARGVQPVPLLFADKNIEYLLYLSRP